MDETRALLDQLMGRERDVPVDKRINRKRRVSDDDICKPFLCGTCGVHITHAVQLCDVYFVHDFRETGVLSFSCH